METAAAPVFAGIDVSKDKLAVAVWPSGETLPWTATKKGWRSFAAGWRP